MKKILFLSSAKLTTLSIGLLIAMFCSIGMSFTPGEEGENVGNPNDTTYVPTSGPRKSHWNTGACGATDQNNKDYAKTSVVTMGHGKVSIKNTTKNGSLTAITTQTSTSAANNEAAISWDCNKSTGGHVNNFDLTATPDDGYYFAGWSTSNTSNTGTSSANPWNIQVTIPHGDKGTSQNDEYETNPYRTVYYAYFGLITYVDVSFASVPEGCSYDITVGGSTQTVSASDVVKTHITEAKLSNPVAASGYVFAGWYQVDASGNVMDITSESPTVKFSENVKLGAMFISTSTPKFKNITKGVEYYGLKMATIAASAGDKIIPVADCVVDGSDLVAGESYTIPAGVTLLIPYNSSNTVATTVPAKENYSGGSAPSPYRTLTLGKNVKITVAGGGAISVASEFYGPGTYNTSAEYKAGVRGPYGFIYMNSESEIILNYGANLYAWGYITGDGEITAQSGSTVYEMMQMTDYRGGSATSDFTDGGVFPFSQYYIQNIESALHMESGATEYVRAAVTASSTPYPATAKLIGASGALYNISSGVLTKKYDRLSDRLLVTMNGNGSMASMALKFTGLPLIGSIDLKTGDYVLPLNSNMRIEVASGKTLTLSQDLAVLPGVEVHISTGAKLLISSGYKMYAYNMAEWEGKGYVFPSLDIKPLNYVARNHVNASGTPKSRSLTNAKIIVDGGIEATGSFFTTESGADICSTIGSNGYIKLVSKAPNNTTTQQATQSGTTITLKDINVTSAKLHNADDTYTTTSGAPANTTINYKHGHWGWRVIWRLEDGTELKRVYHYAQPDASWLDSKAPSTTHPDDGTSSCTYSFTGWEKSTNSDYHEIEWVATYDRTCSAYYTISWKSEDDSETYETDLNVGQSETTRYNGATPTKEASNVLGQTYAFDGWSTEPNGGGTHYNIGETPVATSNATYYAHFAATNVEATVTAGGHTEGFATIDAAFADAGLKRDATIKLFKNISRDNGVADGSAKDGSGCLYYTTNLANNTCVFDLNNHTVDIRANSPIVNNLRTGSLNIQSSNVTFTITDSSAGQGGTISNLRTGRARYTVVVVKAGNLVLDRGKILVNNTGTSVDDNAGVMLYNSGNAVRVDEGTFTMNGGTIDCTGPLEPYAIWVRSGASATINGGTINTTLYSASYHDSYALYVDGGSALVTGGTINATANKTDAYGAYGVYVNGGSAIITGGVINTVSKTTKSYGLYLSAGTAGIISGGKFKTTGTSEIGGVNSTASANDLIVTGGYYNVNNNLATYVQTPYFVAATTAADKASVGSDYNYKVTDKCIVTWNANGGTCDETTTGMTYNQEIGTLPAATKEYHSFDGWFTEPSGGTQISASTRVTADVTYYAHFTPNTHTLTWNANGGTLSGDYTSGIVAYGTAIAKPTITRDEYIFNGWHNGSSIVEPASAMPDNNLTYTAQWTHAKASVTSGETTTLYTSIQAAFTAANDMANSTIKLLEDVAGISGGTCELNYTKANGRCTLDLNNHLLAGTVVNTSSPKMMHINASGAIFTITDNSVNKGGEFRMTKNSARGTYYAIQVSAGTLVVEDGYIYSYNYTTLNGTGFDYGSDAIRLEAGTSLQVTGGKIESKALANAKAIRAIGNSSVTISGGTLIATTTYNGADELSDLAATLYTTGGTTTISDGVFSATTAKSTSCNIYATSASQTITISGGKFKASGGSSMANINDATAAANITLEGGLYTHNTNLSKYEKAPYHVLDLTSGAEFDDGYRYEVKEAYTLGWTTDGEDLTGEYTNGLTPVGATITPPNTPTKTGYTFAGWSDGTDIVDPTTMPAANTTYTATWTINSHTLTWNANGGALSGDYTSGTVAYGTTIVKPTITRDEYIFNGWHNGSSIVEPASAMPDNDLTYTAQWTPAIASVTANDVTTLYATLPAAITAANGTSNAVVTMLQNTTVASQVAISTAMTIDLNGKTITSTVAAATTGAFLISASVTIRDSGTGGRIYQEVSCTGGYLYGIQLTAGTLTIESGTIYTKNTANKRVNGIYADGSATAINISAGGKIETVSAGQAFGIYANNSCALTMNGGTIIANGTSSVRGIYVKGATNLTNATITTTGTSTYTIFAVSGNITINSGTYTSTGGSDNLCIYHRNGPITIGGGYFSATNKLYLRESGSGNKGTITLQGGYYNKDTELEEKCATNYHVLPNDDATYTHKVVEAYNVTFDANGHGTAPDAQLIEKGQKATEPTAPTADGYTFGGWYKEAGCANAWNFASDEVTAAITLYAKWTVADIGNYVDIIDATNVGSNGTLTLNVSSWPNTGWPFTINDHSYTATEDRTAIRTLEIPYEGLVPGADFVIDVKRANGDPYSYHTYKIPEVVSTAELSTGKDHNLYVKGGTLEVTDNVTVKNIYVGADAKLVINEGKTLTADTIFLRTTITSAAELLNNGSIASKTKLCYTRIIHDKSAYFPFGLPLSCDIKDITMSDGSSRPKYGSGWLLRWYDEASRAVNGGSANNWTSKEGEPAAFPTSIVGGRGYEMFSAANYYREFYFPIDHTALKTNTSVSVSYTENGELTDRGWNILVSPFTATCERSIAPEDIAVCWMNANNEWGEQAIPSSIPPGKPFAYQAYSGLDEISFDGATFLAPRRRVAATDEQTRIQWIHLDVENAEGVGDQTSIYTHPTRYEQAYKTGIDVAKQTFEASRALIYSSHAYGEMAFAGVSDELLEKGVALTIYSPSAQSLTISMRENDWLNRMEYVWLIDNATGSRTDLMMNDYRFKATEGTTSGRFILQGVFVPKVATDLQNDGMMNDESRMARKLLIDDKIYIDVNGRRYDATGKLVNGK